MNRRFQKLIRVIIWSSELFRIYILIEVRCLYKHFCYLGEGHTNDIYCTFIYLKNTMSKNPGSMTYDMMYNPTYKSMFEVAGRDLDKWIYLYHDYQELLPRNMPEDLGKSVLIKSYVDDNHAENMANRKSHYGNNIYINNVTTIWYSNHNNMVNN